MNEPQGATGTSTGPELTDGAAQARQEALTRSVVASFTGAPSERFREVMTSLVRHLHAVVREVGLTDAEWQAAVDFLTRTGQCCTDRRQEFVLLSDVLGLSMMTVAVNADPDPVVTESTVLGPFFVSGSPEIPLGGDVANGAPGRPCWVEGSVHGVAGEPVAGARVEIWEADEDGLYDVQYEGTRTANRGHVFTGPDGGFRFWSVRPAAYPIPSDGPVGELLAAAGRANMRPAHIHFMIDHPGYRRMTTHLFAEGDPYLTDDAVFGVTQQLVVSFTEHTAAQPPPGGPAAGPWAGVRYDFVLAPDRGNRGPETR